MITCSLADGEHIFSIEPLAGGRALFTQHENFSGLLVQLVFSSVAPGTEQGFLAMNEALRLRAEQPPLDFQKP